MTLSFGIGPNRPDRFNFNPIQKKTTENGKSPKEVMEPAKTTSVELGDDVLNETPYARLGLDISSSSLRKNDENLNSFADDFEKMASLHKQLNFKDSVTIHNIKDIAKMAGIKLPVINGEIERQEARQKLAGLDGKTLPEEMTNDILAEVVIKA